MSSANISPIRIGAALKSLRNNDFDPYSAIYEVVDNSLQADAKEIKIQFKMEAASGRRKPRPVSIAFGDDGHGMLSDVLQHCLAIGYSQRYDDRKSIGRFGVGMTMGAINVCNKIEVYSRQAQGNWHYTFLDNSGIDQNVDPFLHPVEAKNLPNQYKHLVGDFGTLVIWTKIDRIDSDFKIEELKHRLGRIYRKFIGEEIIKNSKVEKNDNIRKIFVDDGTSNELVTAHDPLYHTKNSKFPEDERAELQKDLVINYPVHNVDAPKSGEKTGKITIRTSILPRSWRVGRNNAELKGYGGVSAHNNARKVFQNEGFSILRNGREVYYGSIPHFSPVTKPLDRFWGGEIDFDPVLDHWFSVKNIKIGARPLKELRDELQKKISPTIRNNFRCRIQEDSDKEEQKESEGRKGPIKSHIEAEDELKPIIAPFPPTQNPDEIKKNIIDHAKEITDDPKEQQEYVEAVSDSNIPFKIIHDSKARSDGLFIDVLYNVGKKVVHYNMNHPFFIEIYRRLKEIEQLSKEHENRDLGQIASELKKDIDRLIYAYAEGQYDLDDLERTQSVGDTVEEHLTKWNLHLRKAYKAKVK